MDKIRSAFTWVWGIGFIALMFPVTCIIWFVTYPFDTDRRLAHRFLRFQGWFLTHTIPLWSFTIEGKEKIRRNQAYVIISNHQSILDILLLDNIRGDYRWISKVENFRVPILGISMRMANYISIDRGKKDSAVRMLEEARQSLERNISIMMFPEGTRSKTKELLPFKLGAFQLALRADKPILPIVVDGTGAVLPKHGYTFSSGHKLRVRILDPVFPGAFGTGDAEEMARNFRKLISDELERMRSGG